MEADMKRVEAGSAMYSRPFLKVYDWVALSFNCQYIWKCPSDNMLEHYNKNVSANHLDIGVGTGYFMEHCKYPSDNPRIALMDLNPNTLQVTSKRLARYNPKTYQRNALAPFDIDAPPFDTVGMMNLIHCIPGNIKTKGIVFEYAKEVMNPGAVLFGSTILYLGVQRNAMATYLTKFNNKTGVMNNIEDSLDDLKDDLKKRFSESSVDLIGCIALFRARL